MRIALLLLILTTPALADTIPNAGHRDASGRCVFNAGIVGDGTLTLDPESCTATVNDGARAVEPDAIAPDGLDPDLLPSPGRARHGNTNRVEPQSLAPRGAIYCPRQEVIHGARAGLQRFSGVRWLNMFNLRTHARFWRNTRSGTIGEQHAYSPPQDWAAFHIGGRAFTRGWRWWYWRGFGPTGPDGPSNVSAYAYAAFRSTPMFSYPETAVIYAQMTTDFALRGQPYCFITGASFSDGYAHRLVCAGAVHYGTYQPCFF